MSHSPGQILGCAYTIFSCGQTSISCTIPSLAKFLYSVVPSFYTLTELICCVSLLCDWSFRLYHHITYIFYSCRHLHMEKQMQDFLLKPTYISSVPIQDIALRTYQKQWTIGRCGERGLDISVLIARHDDDANDLFLLWYSWSLWRCFVLLFEEIQFLLKFPFLCHVQVFSCEISPISRIKRLYCFSSHFCFLVIVVPLVLVTLVLFLVAVISFPPCFSM